MIEFECDDREDAFLEVLPENFCEYTFVVHTRQACPRPTSIGVECRVDGFPDLVAFQRTPARTVEAKGKRVYISVCDPLGPNVDGCDSGSAACLVNGSG